MTELTVTEAIAVQRVLTAIFDINGMEPVSEPVVRESAKVLARLAEPKIAGGVEAWELDEAQLRTTGVKTLNRRRTYRSVRGEKDGPANLAGQPVQERVDADS